MNDEHNGYAGDAYNTDAADKPFAAQITGVNTADGVAYYQWAEVDVDSATGLYVPLTNGRYGDYNPTGPTGAAPALERNNLAVALDTYVELRLRAVVNDQLFYEFDAPPSGSPLTSKGDIFTHDALANARLPVGGDGLTLQTNSTSSTGLQWGSSSWKEPVLVVSLVSVTLAPGVTIDGQSSWNIGDRVLLVGQVYPNSTNTYNGIWQWNGSAWVRPADFVYGQPIGGSAVVVKSGTYGYTVWTCTNSQRFYPPDTNNSAWQLNTFLYRGSVPGALLQTPFSDSITGQTIDESQLLLQTYPGGTGQSGYVLNFNTSPSAYYSTRIQQYYYTTVDPTTDAATASTAGIRVNPDYSAGAVDQGILLEFTRTPLPNRTSTASLRGVLDYGSNSYAFSVYFKYDDDAESPTYGRLVYDFTGSRGLAGSNGCVYAPYYATYDVATSAVVVGATGALGPGATAVNGLITYVGSGGFPPVPTDGIAGGTHP